MAETVSSEPKTRLIPPIAPRPDPLPEPYQMILDLHTRLAALEKRVSELTEAVSAGPTEREG